MYLAGRDLAAGRPALKGVIRVRMGVQLTNGEDGASAYPAAAIAAEVNAMLVGDMAATNDTQGAAAATSRERQWPPRIRGPEPPGFRQSA